MGGLSTMALWVRIPLLPPEAPQEDASGEAGVSGASSASSASTAGRLLDPWEWWTQLRTLCEYNPLLCVALELPPALSMEQVRLR